MYSIFGGDVEDMRVWLAEERLPDGWEPKNREAFGHTITVRFSTLPWAICPGALTVVMRKASANHLARDRVQHP
jgi:hypothetical protein